MREDVVEVFVEIPFRSRNKYEIDIRFNQKK